MDREHKAQRPGAIAVDSQSAATPGRGTLVDEAVEPAIPRLDLRPSGQGTGTGQRAGAQAAPPASDAGSQPAAAHTSQVTHRTEHVAPDNGTRTRTTVAVGEIVHFTAQVAGSWSASQVGASRPATGTGTTYTWKAPSVATTATVTFTPGGAGQAPIATQFNVIAPSVDYRNGVRVAAPNERPGAASVMMHSRVVFGPDTVSFANTMWSEDPGPPTGKTGYFRRWPPRRHQPDRDPFQIDLHNHGPIDEAGYWDLASQDYGEGGTFEWAIPTNYTVFGESQQHLITDVHQHFTLAADGTMSVTKGHASATRRP